MITSRDIQFKASEVGYTGFNRSVEGRIGLSATHLLDYRHGGQVDVTAMVEKEIALALWSHLYGDTYRKLKDLRSKSISAYLPTSLAVELDEALGDILDDLSPENFTRELALRDRAVRNSGQGVPV